MKQITTIFATLAFAVVSSYAQEEVGKVKWGRDVDVAFAASKKSGKPVFLLFQEVPG